MTLHDTEELDDDLRRGADEYLALAAALSVDNVVQAVVLDEISVERALQHTATYQDGHADHGGRVGGPGE